MSVRSKPYEGVFAAETERAVARSETRIRAEVTALTTALAAMLDELPPEARRPSTLAKLLKLDNPLASRLLRLSQTTEPAEAVDLLPTLNQLRRAVTRAGAAAPGKAAADAAVALDRFAALVDDLGGDQRGFESLVSMLSPSGVRRVELQHRREAFRANMHLWGMCLDTVSFTVLQVPGREEGTFDAAFIYGYVGARTIRPNVPFRVRSRLRVAMEPDAPEHVTVETSPMGDVAVLSEFSTVTSANVVALPREADGFERSQIYLEGHRPSDAATIFARGVRRGMRHAPGDLTWNSSFMINWPAANLHVDLISPVGTTVPGDMAVMAYARHDDVLGAYQRREEDRIPLHESVRFQGGVTRLSPLSCVPRISEVFGSTVQWMGLEGTAFDVYRVHIEYPMLHAMVATRLTLRE